ncbi:MAG: riboflavin biosynthesis protein RibF [Elusimicrobia bacterium]|nr:riboflavin biosynthesis protein RibF [Elusimicrobiota bacterium]
MHSLVTIGTFDGVHRGHQRLVRRLLADARRLALRPTVVLFDRPPRFFFHPETASPLITTAEERKELLQRMGVASVRVLPFNRYMSRVPHARFFEEYILRRCRARGLLVGPDFAFGRGRKGDIAWLTQTCGLLGLRFDVMPIVRAGGLKVGSTRIRELLLQGEVREAARLLGRPHSVQGPVTRGDGLGRALGCPTANLAVPETKLAPPGVYKVRVSAVDGRGRLERPGACNVGVRPTVAGVGERRVEVHLLGFSGSLYGRRLKLEFLRRLRGERRFPSLDALREQLRRDLRAAAR